MRKQKEPMASSQVDDDELIDLFNKPRKGEQKNKSFLKTEEQSQIIKSEIVASSMIEKGDHKTVAMISMKAFIYNFKKFYKEKTKIRNLLSEAAARQRNISIQIYFRNHFATYRQVKEMLNQTRDFEKQCMNHFQDLAFKDIHQPSNKQVHVYVRDAEVDTLGQTCVEELDKLFMSKETSFFEKRVLTRFIHPIFHSDSYQPVDYPKIAQVFQQRQIKASTELQLIGNFLKNFMKSIATLNSKISKGNLMFKLVDIAHYLYENKYQREDVQTILRFIQKVKSLYNQSFGLPKTSNVDGDQAINLEFLTLTYSIYNNKDRSTTDLIAEVVNNIRSLLNNYINPKTLERVRKVMEHNIIGDYLQKYFKDLDHQIGTTLTNIEMISDLIMRRIENIDVDNKQEQLEVLLGVMSRIQDNEITEKMAMILQKHGKKIEELVALYDQQIEDAQVRAHSNLNRKKREEIIEEDGRPLYGDDLGAKSGIVEDNRVIVNPYNADQCDQPVRRPKVIDVNSIQASRHPQVQELFKVVAEHQEITADVAKSIRVPEHEELIKALQDDQDQKDQYLISQISQQLSPYKAELPKEYYNLRMNEVEQDLVYGQEFKKVTSEIKPKSKDEMINHLQEKIRKLREDVDYERKVGKQ